MNHVWNIMLAVKVIHGFAIGLNTVIAYKTVDLCKFDHHHEICLQNSFD